ncbi:transporter substrate-binding domain-containing protein [Accumulibacter sp.]|nr:transporter substrate-binding domain-containing protein [Accumulibacter sp.]HRF03464.1 transporter substrate-binding domain-containing protein [Accumulibacter sp.]
MQTNKQAGSCLPESAWLNTLIGIAAAAAIASFVAAGAVHAAAQSKPSSQASAHEELTLATEEATKPWSGDLDGMIDRRIIRILTVYSKTFYFVDKGDQRGSSYDIGNRFVTDLNKQLLKAKKLKQKHLKVQAVFIPVNRNALLSALVAGKGDIAISSIGVTEEREKLVDFSSPLVSNINVVLISGPGSTAISSADDLAGKQVFVRKSSV